MASPTISRRLGLSGGTAIKAPVLLATSGSNITLYGEQTIDGVLTSGSDVLVKDQTDNTQNGIYTSDSATWSRRIDADGTYDLVQGTLVYVNSGSANSGLVYQQTAATPVIGTSAVTWAPGLFSSSSSQTFTQAGTGAVARSAQNKMRDIVSVTDFGATGNGTTDDTTAIQAAITSLGSNGGGLYFPTGTYKITAGLTIAHPMVLFGNGAGSIIAPNFATGDAISITVAVAAAGVVLRDLTFNASVSRTANYYVNFASCNYCQLIGCTFLGGYSGVGLTGTIATGIHIKDCRFNSLTQNNIDVIAQSGTSGCIDCIIKDTLIAGASSGSQSNAGINILCAGDITLDHVSTVYAGIGLNVVPPSGSVVQALFVNDCLFDSGSSHGIVAGGSGTGVVRLFKGENIWACSATGGNNGITLGSNSGTIKKTDLTNVVASNNAGVGILIGVNATNTTLIGGSASQNTSHGVSVAANANLFKIIGMDLGAAGTFTTNGGWGLIVNAGTSDNYIIKGNWFDVNTSGAFSDGGSGTHKHTWPNIGAGGPINATASPGTDWGVDFAKLIGTQAMATLTSYNLAAGSGLVMLHNDDNGAFGMFTCAGGAVTKVTGSTLMVATSAGSSQIGLAYSSSLGVYQITNGSTATQHVYISALKTRVAS